MLFEVPPHHQSGQLEPDIPSTGTSSTPISTAHLPGSYFQRAPTEYSSMVRKGHSPSPDSHAAKRPRPLPINVVLDAGSDSTPSAFKPVMKSHNSNLASSTTSQPRFVKNGLDFGHRRRPNRTSSAVPPQQVSGGGPEPGGVPDTSPVMVTTPSLPPVYATAWEHLLRSYSPQVAQGLSEALSPEPSSPQPLPISSTFCELPLTPRKPLQNFNLHTAEYTSECFRTVDSPTNDDELSVSPEWPDGYDTIPPPPILTQFNSTPRTLRIRYLTRPTSPGHADRTPEVQEVHPTSLKSTVRRLNHGIDAHELELFSNQLVPDYVHLPECPILTEFRNRWTHWLQGKE